MTLLRVLCTCVLVALIGCSGRTETKLPTAQDIPNIEQKFSDTGGGKAQPGTPGKDTKAD